MVLVKLTWLVEGSVVAEVKSKQKLVIISI